ncbi:hypothetical protein CP98_05270 [Sphingobium yanoikuyae]|uniref:Uncharacterized protein n=1 Tax=Sphingobium yanoikuyae TaxID=13690 RepID=A0A084E214_SPHYA|nr:hypothetical protein CP98_05270 [Sphingobium yanoikuyae]
MKSVIVPSVQSPPSMLKLHDFCNRARGDLTRCEPGLGDGDGERTCRSNGRLGQLDRRIALVLDPQHLADQVRPAIFRDHLDLEVADIDGPERALPHLVAINDAVRIHGLDELDGGILGPGLLRRRILGHLLLCDCWIGDEDLRCLVTGDAAHELVDVTALAGREERQRRPPKAVRNRQIYVASHRLVDDREIVLRIARRDLRHGRELILDEADPGEVLGRRGAIDLTAVRRHDRLIGPGRVRHEKDRQADQRRPNEAARVAIGARQEGGAGHGAAKGIDRHH